MFGRHCYTYHRLHVHEGHVLCQSDDALRQEGLYDREPGLCHVVVLAVIFDDGPHGVVCSLRLGVVAVEALQLALGEPVLVHGLGDFRVLDALQQVGRTVVRTCPHRRDKLLDHVLNEVSPHVTDLDSASLYKFCLTKCSIFLKILLRAALSQIYLLPHVRKCGQDLWHE